MGKEGGRRLWLEVGAKVWLRTGEEAADREWGREGLAKRAVGGFG